MDKRLVDSIVTEYMKKIFGFSLSKTMNTDKAEELASRITFDLYSSLLKIDEVNNIDGYVYQVSRNVYARFVGEEVKGRCVSLDADNLSYDYDFFVNFEKNQNYIRLRKEIAYLGKVQREIIVMHYFDKLKQNEIARRLDIPLGTVKWHLHDARNQLKEGVNKMRETGTLGMQPVKFSGMGHCGRPGTNGEDTSFYLSKLISQNIAYCAYHEPKTIAEIANELGVPSAFIEDEVYYLEDNGFMEKTAGGKYLTIVYITESSLFTNEIMEQLHKIYNEYAKKVCDKYIPLVFESMKDFKIKNIYSPKNDFNFLMWSAVVFACGYKLRTVNDETDLSRYNIKRKDGGEYIALAFTDNSSEKGDLSFNNALYEACGDMNRCTRDKYPVDSWQLDTYYDSRKGGWQDNLTVDYEYLYEFITGKINKTHGHTDELKRLYDKGYIIDDGKNDYVNIAAVSSMQDFLTILPPIPEELIKEGEKLDAEIFKTIKMTYPEHMQKLCRVRCTNSLSGIEIRTRVLEQLAASGILKPLTEEQKQSVNTIMFCNVLPLPE